MKTKNILGMLLLGIAMTACNSKANQDVKRMPHDAWTLNAGGNVKEITEDNGATYTFTQDGKFETFLGFPAKDCLSEIKRDEKGRLTHYYFCEPETDNACGCTFVYNDNDQITEKTVEGETSSTYKYEYNDKGHIVSSTTEGEFWDMGADEPEIFITSSTHTYEAFDDHGNWTSRTIVTGEEKSVTTRTITYWE